MRGGPIERINMMLSLYYAASRYTSPEGTDDVLCQGVTIEKRERCI